MTTDDKKAADLQAAAANLPEPPPEEYPRAFGNYVLLAPLARGGMGEVFLAKSGSVAGLEKYCVLKTLRPHLTDDREYSSRFIDEARIVVKLSHRNICQVFDVGTVGERYYLAMEYIPGIDLRSVTHKVGEQSGVVSPGMALHVTCEVLEALDYAHRHVDPVTGTPLLLVHRDVSPQNVMVSWEGEVKLIDFGLAASTMKMEQTSPNVVMGKLAYMSPEQVRGERVDGRTDLFAVGVMLYELLSGERFYEGRSPYEIWGLAAQGNYRPRAWDSLAPEMRAVLDRALADKTSSRFASCSEFREALEAYRFANGLRGDAPMLRQLMHHVFAQEIDESRKRLVTLSQAKLREGPSGSFPHQEPTQSIARASQPTVFPSAAVHEPTGPTQQHIKAALKRPGRTWPMAAAAALVVFGVVGAGVAYVKSRPPPPTTAIPAPAQPVLPPAPPVLVEAPPSPPVAAQVDVEVPAEAQVEEAVDAVDDEPKAIASAKKKKKKRSDKHIDPQPIEKPVEAVAEKPVEPAAEKPGDKTADDKPSWSDLAWGERVSAMEKRCASLKCVREIAQHKETYGKLQKDELIPWQDAVRSCWKQCGLP